MSELDDLMSLNPFDPSQDIDKIIAAHRAHRARLASGVKVKREKGPVEQLDLASLGLIKPVAPMKRRGI